MRSDGNADRAVRAGRREWIAPAVLSLPCMLVTMDLTVLFLALPKLAADLRLARSGSRPCWPHSPRAPRR
jgi:DHA2 family multidrug resistance protein-like MFS transporter